MDFSAYFRELLPVGETTGNAFKVISRSAMKDASHWKHTSVVAVAGLYTRNMRRTSSNDVI